MWLGEIKLPIDDLVSRITERFPFHATIVDQTNFLRRALQELGSSLGYRVLGSPSNFASGECLDLAWWEPGTGTVLAADCAWGNAGEVFAAFTRLMTRKSAVKLLVFCGRQAGADREDILLRSDTDAVLAALGSALLDFRQHLTGELYVLVERVERQSLFRYYQFAVPSDGKLAFPIEEAPLLFRGVMAV